MINICRTEVRHARKRRRRRRELYKASIGSRYGRFKVVASRTMRIGFAVLVLSSCQRRTKMKTAPLSPPLPAFPPRTAVPTFWVAVWSVARSPSQFRASSARAAETGCETVQVARPEACSRLPCIFAGYRFDLHEAAGGDMLYDS